MSEEIGEQTLADSIANAGTSPVENTPVQEDIQAPEVVEGRVSEESYRNVDQARSRLQQERDEAREQASAASGWNQEFQDYVQAGYTPGQIRSHLDSLATSSEPAATAATAEPASQDYYTDPSDTRLKSLEGRVNALTREQASATQQREWAQFKSEAAKLESEHPWAKADLLPYLALGHPDQPIEVLAKALNDYLKGSMKQELDGYLSKASDRSGPSVAPGGGVAPGAGPRRPANLKEASQNVRRMIETAEAAESLS